MGRKFFLTHLSNWALWLLICCAKTAIASRERALRAESNFNGKNQTKLSLLVKIKGGVNERFWELNYSLLKVLFEVPENNKDFMPKIYLFLDNNMIKVMATIQFLRRRSCGGFCPQTGRSTSRCCVAWTEEAPKGICDHCGPFYNIFFILNFVWKPYFLHCWIAFWDCRIHFLLKLCSHLIPAGSRRRHGRYQENVEEFQLEKFLFLCLCHCSNYYIDIETLNLRGVINVFERVI